MDYKNTINSILIDIDEVRRIIEKFKNYDKIPQIDIDLALTKFRNLYDLILMIELENKGLPTVTHTENIQKTETKRTITVVEKNEPSPGDILLEESPHDIPEDKQPREESKEVIKKQATKENAEILAEKYRNTQFRNESMGEKVQKKDLSSKIQSKPIDDIKKAIGLNDKFLFIKELFHSNSDLYNEAIEVINQAGNYIEALNYLKANYDWDYQSEEVTNFLDIVKRKFAVS